MDVGKDHEHTCEPWQIASQAPSQGKTCIIVRFDFNR